MDQNKGMIMFIHQADYIISKTSQRSRRSLDIDNYPPLYLTSKELESDCRDCQQSLTNVDSFTTLTCPINFSCTRALKSLKYRKY